MIFLLISRQYLSLNATIFLIFRKAHLSSKKLLEQCQKLEKLWTHVYTGTLNLTSITAESQWYTKLSDLIDKQQTAPIWMSESKVITFVIFEIRHLSNLFILIYIKSVNLQKNITIATASTFRRKHLVFMKFFEHYYWNFSDTRLYVNKIN